MAKFSLSLRRFGVCLGTVGVIVTCVSASAQAPGGRIVQETGILPDGTKFVRLVGPQGVAAATMFVEDEFIVVFKPTAADQVRIARGQARPATGISRIDGVVAAARVTEMERQFPTATRPAPDSAFTDLTGYYKVKIEAGADLNAAMARFAADAAVDHVEPIGIHPLYSCASGSEISANDTYYNNPPPTFNWPQWDLWNTNGIDADKAWVLETGDPSVVVVDMDSGVKYLHGDLGGPNPPGPADNSTNGNVWVNPFETPGNGIDDELNGRIDDVIGYDFVTGNPVGCASAQGEDCNTVDNDPKDFNGHGTHTSGTMAAITNNAKAIAGIAGGFGNGTTGSPGNGSKIMTLRIGWSDTAGNGFVRMDFAAAAMNYVADMKNRGINIAAVNCSWGTSNSGGIDAAVNNVLAADVMIIHAAGNGNTSVADYMGNKAGVLNVAATTSAGTRASFSNFGPWVDMAAPGVAIISTYFVPSDPIPDYVAVSDGTSMAAPHVAGVAALLESCDPSLTGPQKFNILVANVCTAGSPNIGGILNAKLALDAAGCGAPECDDNGDCDDGLFCNGAETCSAGSCQAGSAPNCNDGIACTVDSCNEGTDSCDHAPNNAACDDGQFCNGAETCNVSLGCQAGTPPNCDDGLFCNGVETCSGGSCQAGSDPCPGQVCDEGTDTCLDCITNGDCDDGLFCNGAETCSAGSCQAGTAPNCDDGIACTGDSCNEGTDSCDHAPNNAACDDGLFCNGAETCNVSLGCQAGTAPNCNDGIACTVDSCNEGTDSCDHAPNNAACDDGLFCNGAETCNASLGCQAGANPCPGQSCDEGTDTCISGTKLWLSFLGTTTVPTLGTVADEDIVAYDLSNGTWSWIFDGSDVGLSGLTIGGMSRLANGDILLSFTVAGSVPGLIGGPSGSTVDDSDIVRFTPTTLGATTSGTFNFYFDGSDVGLTANDEEIDGIALVSGRIAISTIGNFSGTGASGVDKDLFLFTATTLGSVTSGSFSVHFDGSDVGLTTTNEDIDAAGVTSAGALLLSTLGGFSVPGVSGADEDVLQFTGTFGSTTSGTYSMFLDLSTIGIATGADVTAVEIVAP
jgi:subtilisin family serine protease